MALGPHKVPCFCSKMMRSTSKDFYKQSDSGKSEPPGPPAILAPILSLNCANLL